MKRDRLRFFVAALVVVVVAQIFASRELFDPDTWWHITNGEAVLDTGSEAPLAVFGAHHCPDASPLIYRYSDPVFAWLWRAGGLPALLLARAAAALLLALVTVFLLRRTSRTFMAVAGSLVVAGVAGRLAERPELFSYALIGVQLALFFAALRTPWRVMAGICIAAILVVELAWAQIHSAYTLAPLLFFVAAAGVVIERIVPAPPPVAPPPSRKQAPLGRMSARKDAPPPNERIARAAAAFIAAVAGVAASPVGFAIFASSAHERSIAKDIVPIVEWQSPIVLLFTGPRDLPALALMVVLVVAWLATLLARHEPGFWPRFALGGALLAMALDSARSLPLFALGALLWLPYLAALLARLDVRPLSLALGAVAAAVVLAGGVKSLRDSILIREGTWSERAVSSLFSPVGAAAYAKEHELRGLAFAPIAGASYMQLIAPTLTPLWTGRRTYAPACGRALAQARAHPAEKMPAVLAEYGDLAFILVDNEREDALFRFLGAAQWKLAYFDPRWSLFARPASDEPPTGGIPADPAAALRYERKPLPGDEAGFLLLESCRRLAYAGFLTQAESMCTGAIARDDTPEARAELAKLRAFMAPRGGSP